jgi:hypothetical protein
MPRELIDAVVERRVALFAGAGISTENPLVFPTTFYNDIKTDLGIREILPFPELMARFEQRPNGRLLLLSRIRRRLDYLNDFIDVKMMATRFHEELATIPQIQEIYTTNWDDLLEEQCGAVPFVTSQDFAFWNLPGRKVLKLHGSITNYGSLVITTKDYDKCYAALREGLVGSQLKITLSTKTMLFVGYSLSDYDFNRIYGFIRQEMGDVLPQSYVVTLSGDVGDLERSGLHAIRTDATYFMHVLARHLVEKGKMLPPDYPENAMVAASRLSIVHERLFKELSIRTHPSIIYTAAYQDGMDHGLKFVAARSRTGYSSDPGNLHASIDSYENEKRNFMRTGNFWDAAYVEGFICGLEFPMLSPQQREQVPLHFAFGAGRIQKWEELVRAIENARSLHKASFDTAKQKVAATYADGTVIQHSAFL